MHGLGGQANEFENVFNIDGLRVILPQAPDLPISGYPGWTDVLSKDLRYKEGVTMDELYTQYNQDQINSSADSILKIIKDENLDPSKVFVGGFS